MTKPTVRIAPSPTGKLHIGTARTALFNYLFAKNQGGKFLLRLEDTDETRSTLDYEKNIITGLKWLGFNWDGKVERQMKRLKIYQKYCQKLLQEKKEYYCFCSKEELEKERKKQLAQKQPPRYSGRCRGLKPKEVKEKIAAGLKTTCRLKVPAERGMIKFKDLIRGEIQEAASTIGDFVIIK